MALFTGAFFVAQVSLIIVAKPFYAIFCTSCIPHKPKVGIAACQMVDNLERLGTLWYAMKQIWHNVSRYCFAFLRCDCAPTLLHPHSRTPAPVCSVRKKPIPHTATKEQFFVAQ